MMRHNNIRFFMSVAVLLLLAVAVSCNSFEYGYDENNPGDIRPNESHLNFSVSWDQANLPSGKIPEGLTVLMSRKVNTLHYVWQIDGNGAFIIPEPEVSETDAPEASEPVMPIIRNGDYYAIAYSDDAGFYQFTSNSEFAEDPSKSMLDLYVSIPSLPDDEVSPDKDLIDFNSYAGFVKHAECPLYLDILKDVVFPSSISPVALHPKDLTRELTFRIKATTEDGVTIDRIIGVLSGVATRIQLMSGLMTRANTAKVAFEMECVGTEDGLDKEGRPILYDIYEGKVRLFGLFPPEDKTFITGPGILQVSVEASVTDGGKTRNRVFHAGVNLLDLLEDADLMMHSADKTGYSMIEQKQIGKIVVQPILNVMKNHIMANEAEGLDQWIENEAEILPEV